MQLTLWPVDDKPQPSPCKKARRGVCAKCKKGMAPKPRSVMPLGHAVETVRGIMIDRLDAALPDLEAIALAVAGEYLEERGHAMSIAIRFIQAAQVRLFPDEFGDGPEYTPDPAGRMDVPPNPLALVPHRPTTAIYARHLLAAERQTAAGQLTQPDGTPLLTDADLVRLAERRAGRQAAG